MRRTPLVSVVVPCYNAARFLGDTLESVAGQTLSDWELIVVDDGSTDGSRPLIEQWGSRLGDRFKAHFGPNRGASAARDTGTAMARGKFIQYVDADDLLRRDTLLRRVNALTDGADVAYCDWQKLVEGPDGRFTLGEQVARTLDDVHARPDIALFTSFWSPPAALLYRSTVVDAIGGWNRSLPVVEDARFALDAALLGATFVHVPGVGAEYRVQRGSESLSNRDPMRFVLCCFRNACQVEDHWRRKGELDEDQRAALADCYGYTSRTLLRGDYSVFRENLQRLYRVQPGFQLSYPKVAGLVAAILGPATAARLMRPLQQWHRLSS